MDTKCNIEDNDDEVADLIVEISEGILKFHLGEFIIQRIFLVDTSEPMLHVKVFGITTSDSYKEDGLVNIKFLGTPPPRPRGFISMPPPGLIVELNLQGQASTVGFRENKDSDVLTTRAIICMKCKTLEEKLDKDDLMLLPTLANE